MTAAPSSRFPWHPVQAAAVILAIVIGGTWVVALARLATGSSWGFYAYGPRDGSAGLLVLLDASAGPVAYSGLNGGDRIVEVDGVRASDPAFGPTFWRRRAAGERLDLRVERAGAPAGSAERVSVSLFAPLNESSVALQAAGAFVSVLATLLVGLVVPLVRPREPAVRPLMVFMFSQVAALGAGASWLAVSGETWHIALRLAYLFQQLAGAGMLHLFLTFPETQPLLLRLRRVGPPWLRTLGGATALLYVVPVTLGWLWLQTPPTSWAQVQLIYVVLLLGAVASIVRGYRRASSPLMRAQLKWLFAGVLILAATFGGYAVATLLAGQQNNAGAAVIFASSGAVPITTGFAVLRYRLFDVDAFLRASVTYVTLTALLVGAFLAVTFAVTRTVVALAGPEAANDTTITLFAALLIAAGATPALRRLQAGLDRLIYRARVARRRFLDEAAELLSRVQPVETVHGFLTQQASQRLGLSNAWLALPDSLVAGAGRLGVLPADPKGLLSRLEAVRGPVILSPVDLSASAVETLPVDDPAVAPWYAAGARLLVPLRTEAAASPGTRAADAGTAADGAAAQAESRPLAVWALGELRSGGVPGREDIEAVGRVGQQAAVLLDYARLSVEQVRQALVAQDLTRAREIQARLLPASRAAWAGRVEVAARLQPARETSGDFYDLFSLGSETSTTPPGHTSRAPGLQIAVGDVQGKGMGAALVMALAQATLRTAAHECRSVSPAVPVMAGAVADRRAEGGVSVPVASPASTLALAGGLLHRGVGMQDFVCCALAVLEESEDGEVDGPGGRDGLRLRVANAAQVPPLLCREGTVTELVPEGERLPLGIVNEPRYQDLTVTLRSGDVVVLTTDGLPEAPASTELAVASAGQRGATAPGAPTLAPPRAPRELFGFDRLAESSRFWSSHAASADGVLQGIWSDVESWCGQGSHHDDMTVVVLRVS